MTVLVTGATGFLGSHVVDALVGRGAERVRALARPGEPVEDLAQVGVEICRGDLCDRSSLAAGCKGADCVIHCAARTGVWGPRSEYEAVNVRGLSSLIDAALAAGVQRFVHVSSIAVLGADVGGVADETMPPRIDSNPYSWSKLMGELAVAQAIHERRLPAVIIRPGWIYGPRDEWSFARLAAKIDHGRMVQIGSGKNRVPLIYVCDVAEGILLACASHEAIGRTFNLVNDEPVTQHQFFAAIAAHLGVPAPSRSIPYRLALATAFMAEALGRLANRQQSPPITRYGVQLLGGENQFVIAKARRELGFSPRVNLVEGVRRTFAWYRDKYQPMQRQSALAA